MHTYIHIYLLYIKTIYFSTKLSCIFKQYLKMLSFLLSITRKGIIGVEWIESKKSNEAGGRECFS